MSNLTFPQEPALYIGLLEAILALLIAFGVPVTSDEKVAIMGVATAVIALVGAFITRSQVTPNASAPAPH